MKVKGDKKMRISNIPTAINLAKVQSTLTQYRPANNGVMGTSEKPTAVLNASLVSSENDYTKKDALMKQWNKEGSFNLYEVMNGGKVNLQNPNPSVEELLEFEKQMQEKGIMDDVDWSDFEFDLKGIGFPSDSPTYRLGADDFKIKTDYLASRYAAMKDRIQNNFSGQERKEQLEKLDTLYGKAIEEIAGGYSDIVGDFFEQNGVSGKKEKIYNSIVNGVKNKVEEYQKYLSGNPDFMGLKGTKDEWLLQDDEYVASLLRGESIESVPSRDGKDSYTLKDLDLIGRFVSELSRWEADSNIVNIMDEERIGLDFAMLSMKVDYLRKEGEISSTLDQTLQKVLDGFMKGFLERTDDKLADLRNQNATWKDEEGYAGLDRQAVWNIYNATMGHYKKSGDVMEALIHGAQYGVSHTLNNTNNETYRKMNNRLYWANFFEKTVEVDSGLYSYDSPETTYQKYVIGWNDFKISLQEGDGIRVNVKLKSSNLYTNTMNFNQVDERV